MAPVMGEGIAAAEGTIFERLCRIAIPVGCLVTALLSPKWRLDSNV